MMVKTQQVASILNDTCSFTAHLLLSSLALMPDLAGAKSSNARLLNHFQISPVNSTTSCNNYDTSIKFQKEKRMCFNYNRLVVANDSIQIQFCVSEVHCILTSQVSYTQFDKK